MRYPFFLLTFLSFFLLSFSVFISSLFLISFNLFFSLFPSLLFPLSFSLLNSLFFFLSFAFLSLCFSFSLHYYLFSLSFLLCQFVSFRLLTIYVLLSLILIVEVKVTLRPIVSRPVYPGIGRPSGTRDQFDFFLEIFFRQLRFCNFVAPSLTRGRVLPKQSLLGRSPAELRPYFTVSFETPPTWRARFPYLYPPGTGWPSYTPGHWVSFLSPLTTRRAAVELFYPASTRVFILIAIPFSFLYVSSPLSSLCLLYFFLFPFFLIFIFLSSLFFICHPSCFFRVSSLIFFCLFYFSFFRLFI
jgi:hypothetical protein